MRATFHHFVVLSGCALVLILSGCAASSGTVNVNVPSDIAHMPDSEREELLRSESMEWRGTPHVLGGTSTRGVDCSGLVQTVFRSNFGVQMPRTTETQVQAGHTVRRSDLRPGDLVFFRPTPKTRHVGIYLSDGEFMHAAASTGVSVDKLDNSYWNRRYWTARRILPESDPGSAARSVAEDTSRDSAEPAQNRSGW